MADGSLVEVDLNTNGTNRQAADGALWGDRHYDGLTTTDGVDISSRTKHREFMKRHGLATYDDFKGEFDKREADRSAYRTGERGSVSRSDIEQAIHRLMGR
jgi:hypothetical protein